MSGAQAVFGQLRPMRGPSALGGDPRRFWTLTWTLAVLEFRLKFFGSVLGYFWQLMRPLLLFGVLYFVFTQLVRLGGGVKNYPVMLLMGIIIYTFYAEATGTAVASVPARESLVRKVHFPRLVIPLSVVLTTYLNFVLNFLAVVVFVLASGIEPRWSWFEIFPLILGLGILCTGIGTMLSALFVRYRDVQPIWDVALQISFYASPILYPIETIPDERLQHLIMCSPLAVIVQQARHAIIDPNAASAAEAIGGAPRLLIPLALLIVVCVLGYWIFDRSAPSIAEEL
ncbi:MAG: ABC transporter permease [Actinomycetota bacterium]|nr:ABC transporter permease [Actinomycetota bacterium]